MSIGLQLAVEEAIHRIKRDYERTEGKIFLSFSGGADSTILAELIKLADLSTAIPFVFANTGVELNATVDFVRQYDYEHVVIAKPRKPFGVILKDYGKPVRSKMKSAHLATYQRNIEEPLKTARQRHLILGEAEKQGKKLGFRTRDALAKRDFHFLHPNLEYQISNKCCEYMKKLPLNDFAKENEMNGTFTGIRIVEGGVRAMQYKSCVHIKNQKGQDYLTSMPLFDWTNELCDEFIRLFEVKLSEAYTTYGMSRTGCMGCPFSKNLRDDLFILYQHEPLKYKAAMKWLQDVYMDQGVACEWDEAYMCKFIERQVTNDDRREEMLDKFSPYFNRMIRKL